jgi:hypothetical protein
MRKRPNDCHVDDACRFTNSAQDQQGDLRDDVRLPESGERFRYCDASAKLDEHLDFIMREVVAWRHYCLGQEIDLYRWRGFGDLLRQAQTGELRAFIAEGQRKSKNFSS